MADNVAVTEGSGKTIATDEDGSQVQHQYVKLEFGGDGSFTKVSASDPLPTVVGTTDTITVKLDPSAGLIGIQESVAVYFDRGNPTVTEVNSNAIKTAVETLDNAISGNEMQVDVVGSLPAGTNAIGKLAANNGVDIGDVTINGFSSSVGVYFDRANPSVTANAGTNLNTSTLALESGGNLASAVTALQIIDDWDESDRAKVNPIVGQAGVSANSGVVGDKTLRVVHATDVAGSVNVTHFGGGAASTPNTGIPQVNVGGTMSIFTVSGSTSTAGNTTLVSPSANYNFKVFAYSIQTTGAVSLAARFTTGASAGATELWRPLVTAAGVTGVQGANLVSAPNSPIFVTGTSTTLSLYIDTATLTHYSVSYVKETA